MDDESYFSLNGDEFSSNRGYYSDNKLTCSNKIRFKERQKFPPRVLMWIAICEDGQFSKPFFMQKGNMNGDLYLKECITKRLLPFVRSKSESEVIFWPDGATAHYKKCVTEFLTGNNIRFVAKMTNPPKVPELRPIEHYWSLLKASVYANGWVAKDKEQLIRRIREKVNCLDYNVIQRMMKQVRTKVRTVSERGIDYLLK